MPEELHRDQQRDVKPVEKRDQPIKAPKREKEEEDKGDDPDTDIDKMLLCKGRMDLVYEPMWDKDQREQ